MKNKWIFIFAALLLAAGVGVIAYNAGVARGVVQPETSVAAPWATAHPHPHSGWHPGVGFLFVPLLFMLFCFLIARTVTMPGRRCNPVHEWRRRAHDDQRPMTND